MDMKKTVIVASVAFSALLAAGLSTSGLAGFEWRGSKSAVSAPAAPAPIGIDGPVMPTQKVDGVDAMPLFNASKAPSSDVVSGFGSDLPLAVALQQVTPPGYRYSFTDGADPGVLVSWEGGRDWKSVMGDMLGRSGLSYKMNDNVVTVSRSAPAPVPSAATASAPIPLARPAPAAPAAAPKAAGSQSWMERFARKPAPSAPAIDDKEFAERKAQLDTDLKTNAAAISAKPVPPPLPVTSVPVPPPASTPAPVKAQISWDAPVPVVAPVPVKEVKAAPAKAEDAAPVSKPQRLWLASKGRSLRDVLSEWCKKDGIDLYWSIDYDYVLNDDAVYQGSFDRAVAQLLYRFSRLMPQPYGQLHELKEGGRVLIVDSYDSL